MHPDPHAHAHLGTELAEVLGTILAPGQRFEHRHHIHLTFVAVHRYGMPAATDKVEAWIRQIAAQHGAPHKYHHTITRAWVEVVAHHVRADRADPGEASDFGNFARRHHRLFDKHLLAAHYRPGTLASDHARRTWTEPDLARFPWSP
jgi:hypothetical protein